MFQWLRGLVVSPRLYAADPRDAVTSGGGTWHGQRFESPAAGEEGGEGGKAPEGGAAPAAEAAKDAGEGTEGKPESGGGESGKGGKGETEEERIGRIVKQRLDEEAGRQKSRLRAAGLDPETLKPIEVKKDPPAPAAAEYGKEPWRGDFLKANGPKPTMDDKSPDGSPKWGDYQAFYEALADWKYKEGRAGEQFEAGERNRTEETERTQRERREREDKLFNDYRTKKIPEFCKAENITVADFGKALEAAPKVDMPDPLAQALAAAIMMHAKDPAQLLYRMAKTDPLVLSAMAAELQATPADRMGAELVGLVRAMDERVRLGFTLDGKPRQGKAPANDGEGGGGGSARPSPGASGDGGGNPGGGTPGDIYELKGDAFFRAREQQDRDRLKEK